MYVAKHTSGDLSLCKRHLLPGLQHVEKPGLLARPQLLTQAGPVVAAADTGGRMWPVFPVFTALPALFAGTGVCFGKLSGGGSSGQSAFGFGFATGSVVGPEDGVDRTRATAELGMSSCTLSRCAQSAWNTATSAAALGLNLQ